MAEAEVDPLVGQILSGRFEIVAPLGVGGMGRVYRAVQQPLGREVALKVLNPRYDGTRDPGFERRFFLEASMTAKLKHPNTITVHDYGRTDDGIFFIAMEYLEGETLQKVLAENGRLPWPRAVFIAGQVARSLREAHKLGMVHRDLKPANVMLMTEGTGGDTVKVLDFGLVKSFTPERPREDEVDRTGLTQAGVLLGSPLYMAPEQARGEADPRTDIYALGVVMFQTMAGRPPFVSRESIDVIVKHIREKPPELRSLVPELPLEINALVMKCLEKEPAARFQTMDELLDAMRVATAGQGLSGAFADPRTQSGIMPRTSTPAMPAQSATATPNFTSAESVRSLEIELGDTGARAAKSRVPLVLGVTAVIVLGASIGGVVAWNALKPTPKPVTPLVTPPRPAEVPVVVVPAEVTPAEVRFEIDSQPQGATVMREGVQVGVTPFALTLSRKDTAPVQVELAFALEGYELAQVVAQGLDGVVTVSKVLTRKPEPTRPAQRPVKKPKNPSTDPNGYKEDPY